MNYKLSGHPLLIHQSLREIFPPRPFCHKSPNPIPTPTPSAPPLINRFDDFFEKSTTKPASKILYTENSSPPVKQPSIEPQQTESNDTPKYPDAYLCPITFEILEEPVVCADGHTYEKSAIELWLKTHNTSPKTNAPLPHKHLIVNYALKNAIEEWKRGNL